MEETNGTQPQKKEVDPLVTAEIEMYDEVIKLIRWTYNQRGELFAQRGIPVPVIVGKKRLVRMTDRPLHSDKFITFRPLRNNRQCQFLMDYLYEREGDEVSDITLARDPESGMYSARMRGSGGDVVMQVKNCRTETEAKFRIFVKRYFGKRFSPTLKALKAEDERLDALKKTQENEKDTGRKR